MVEKIKVAFVSNYLSHHQIPFSNEMYNLLGDRYNFISTAMMSDERKNMGWSLDGKYPYEIKTYESETEKFKALELINSADIVILGSASDKYIINRLKNNKLTFKYSERLYKKGLNIKGYPRAMISAWLHHGRFQKYPIYMLCASAYTARDLSLFRNYKKRMYKWGYFPEGVKHNLDNLFAQKDNEITEILWVGRLIDWKHADHAIEIANRLVKDGHSFKLNVIGTGIEQSKLVDLVKQNKLEKYVYFLGTMKPIDVRKFMEKSNIYLFTSDFNEGWGAVLNESMNSGCAVVASHAIGSVPFLLKHEENGLIYENGNLDDLYNKVLSLINNKELQKRLGVNAYNTIRNNWNEKTATLRFLDLCKNILNEKEVIFEDGPCSKAEILTNDWWGK